MSATVDIQGEICDALSDAGITAWRNRLPAGFDNTAPAVQVELQDDAHHQSGAIRRAAFVVRVYGGSMLLADVRETTVAVLDALQQLTTESIALTGSFRVGEPPPEPDTGWPMAVIRFGALVKER